MSNIITAKFSKGAYSTTAKIFRYDVGDKLRFVGLKLPDVYRVDFSNSLYGEAETVFCDSDTVEIPPEYVIPGSTIYAWVVLTQANGWYTKYQVNIPVSPRAKPLNIEPTPAQQDALDEAIEALNNVTEDIQGEIDLALEAAKNSGEFNGTPGTTIWLYDGQPVLPNYTFYKYLMRANSGAVPKQFDFILLDSVLYQIISVSDLTCKAIKHADLKGTGIPSGGSTGQYLTPAPPFMHTDYLWWDVPEEIKILEFTYADGVLSGPEWHEAEDALDYGIMPIAKLDIDGVHYYLHCSKYEEAGAGSNFTIQFSTIVGEDLRYLLISSDTTDPALNTWKLTDKYIGRG